MESYRILALYGDNVLTTEGEEWRRHRKVCTYGAPSSAGHNLNRPASVSYQIVAPGFSEKVFDLVWRTSTTVIHEMMQAEGFTALRPNERTDVKDITHLTIRVSLESVRSSLSTYLPTTLPSLQLALAVLGEITFHSHEFDCLRLTSYFVSPTQQRHPSAQNSNGLPKLGKTFLLTTR